EEARKEEARKERLKRETLKKDRVKNKKKNKRAKHSVIELKPVAEKPGIKADELIAVGNNKADNVSASLESITTTKIKDVKKSDIESDNEASKSNTHSRLIAIAASVIGASLLGVLFLGGEEGNALSVSESVISRDVDRAAVEIAPAIPIKDPERAEFALFDAPVTTGDSGGNVALAERKGSDAESAKAPMKEGAPHEEQTTSHVNAASTAKNENFKKAETEKESSKVDRHPPAVAKVDKAEKTPAASVVAKVVTKQSSDSAPVTSLPKKIEKNIVIAKAESPNVSIKKERTTRADVNQSKKTKVDSSQVNDSQKNRKVVQVSAVAALPIPVIPKMEKVVEPETIDSGIALSETELKKFMTSFKWFYESGDANLFSRLFAEDARTNDNIVGRQAIKKDYGALFSATESRRIEVTNLTWNSKGAQAFGNGLFKLIIISKGTGESSEISGQILVRVEKEAKKKRPEIKGLFYNYSVASVE
ncbi:MAG: hypothetical protein OEX19_04360, partial [Gammaproteobacteria bacterium]|nr:hypothetical protein [Gammaproteobacteria bacterium]